MLNGFCVLYIYIFKHVFLLGWDKSGITVGTSIKTVFCYTELYAWLESSFCFIVPTLIIVYF